MARWKLATAHYLMVEGGEWEYVEQDRNTGRPIRKKFLVPRMLNPNDPQDWTNRWGNKDNEDGEIVVCREGRGEPRDIVYAGDPTPDMIPVDDEARAESAGWEDRWRYKPDDPNAVGFSQALVDKFQIDMAPKPVEVTGLDALVAAIAGQTATMSKLLETAATRRP